MPEITINDITLSYQLENEASTQPPLVFLHGATLTHASWTDQMAYFAPRHPVLAYDYRNHGASSLTPGEHDLEIHTEDLMALLETVGFERERQPVLIGLSMGGMVAMRAALRSSEVARALVLVNTTSQGWQPPESRGEVQATVETLTPEGLEHWLGVWEEAFFTPAFRAANPDRLVEWRKRYRAQSGDQYREAMLGLLTRRDITEYLGIIDSPTLVLGAAQDVTIPPQLAEALAKAIPGAALQMLPDCAHLCNEEQPAAFNVAVESFLRKQFPR